MTKDELQMIVSLCAIVKRLSSAELENRVAARERIFTASAHRIELAKRLEDWVIEQWEQVVFSDEPMLTSCWNQ
ncbi:hypothetical protein HPB48_015465 [Haemaphysalis longicornis]|uniref:Uncharacterized protein n=1 Tax=Haemaphysalis longicornis TaxID=44386 RepID=A0A9J6FHW9_HAELO|nr:hypothetical protein HPB48_015465 [Haemaphysalis longicornis]